MLRHDLFRRFARRGQGRNLLVAGVGAAPIRRARKGLGRLDDGFTLIEVIVVVAVIALLAGLIMPSMGSVSDDAKATKILAVADTLKKAVDQHYAHTSALALENSTSTLANRHQLSITQTTPGWKGPYLDHPLRQADNPYGGDVIVYTSFDAGGGAAPQGFDLLGGGTATATGAGQYVAFNLIPLKVAQAVDNALDRGVRGAWDASGRVEYVAASQRLNIYLMDQ